jgi:hypothetical protein
MRIEGRVRPPSEAQTMSFGPEYVNIQETWTLRIDLDPVLHLERQNPNSTLIIGDKSLPFLIDDPSPPPTTNSHCAIHNPYDRLISPIPSKPVLVRARRLNSSALLS